MKPEPHRPILSTARLNETIFHVDEGDIFDSFHNGTEYNLLDFSNQNFYYEDQDYLDYVLSNLHGTGVIDDYPDGTFKAGNTVNRAELMKILVEGKGVTPDPEEYLNCFPDVTNEWFAPYVRYAFQQGWVEGYPDGNFRPADTVNKVELLKMLLNSNSIVIEEPGQGENPYDDVPWAAWYSKYVLTAKKLGDIGRDRQHF